MNLKIFQTCSSKPDEPAFALVKCFKKISLAAKGTIKTYAPQLIIFHSSILYNFLFIYPILLHYIN